MHKALKTEAGLTTLASGAAQLKLHAVRQRQGQSVKEYASEFRRLLTAAQRGDEPRLSIAQQVRCPWPSEPHPQEYRVNSPAGSTW